MIVEEKILRRKEKLDGFSKDLYLSLLHEDQSIYLNARGMSMYPFIKTGDKIKIEPIEQKDITIGSIVAVDTPGKKSEYFLVHRVVKIGENNGNRIYFTKGDFHKQGLDKPVIFELIRGRISQIQRNKQKIDLEHPIWKPLNNIIAKLSLRHPRILCFVSRYINLIIEWRSFPYKVKNRIRKGNPVLYNAEELLLLCLRKDFGEKLKEVQELIKEGIDWQYFTNSAMKNGVTVLVYNALKKITPYLPASTNRRQASVHIPQFVFDRLESYYFYIIKRTAFQHKELINILKLFYEKNIPVIPLKGIFLADRLYGDISARDISVDFDLLIREEDKNIAKNMLEEIGYKRGEYENVEKWQWNYKFLKSEAHEIHLHWDITMMNRCHRRIKGLWQGSKQVEKDGISFYEFKEEELLLYLSTHLVNSGDFGQLRYACDINQLLYKYKNILDWNSIIEKAKRWGLSNSLYTTLKLPRNIFNSDVPLFVLQKLKANLLKSMLIEAFINRKVILRDCLRKRFINVFLSYIFFELVEANSLSEYLAVFRRVFFPPKKVMGERDYMVRIFKGTLKLLKKLDKY